MPIGLDYACAWLIARLRISSDRGASLVEYALLVGLIAVVCIAAVTLLGKQTSNKFSRIASTLANS